MSLGTALNNALSGLGAASLAAEVVASNISNATNEAYATRSVVQTGDLNGGVKVIGISRQRDQALYASALQESAALTSASTTASSLAALSDLVGEVGEDTSLTTKLDSLQSALISAESQPESTVRQTEVLYAAEDLAVQINEIADGIQTQRSTADQSIASDVETANDLLSSIESLNSQILSVKSMGQDASALLDQRDQSVAALSEIIPVRTLSRSNDTIALISNGGQMLLDSKAVELEFEATSAIGADMTADGGALSGITIKGSSLGDISHRLTGGSIGANLEIRDELMPAATEELNALTDSLLAATAIESEGLFTGEAGTLEVNSTLTDEPWRLRDGFAVAVEGDTGAAGYFSDLSEALDGLSDAFGDYASSRASVTLRAEEVETQSAARYAALTEAQASEGVDSDQELQNLLLIEKTYAANAKVISAVDEMLENLLGMV